MSLRSVLGHHAWLCWGLPRSMRDAPSLISPAGGDTGAFIYLVAPIPWHCPVLLAALGLGGQLRCGPRAEGARGILAQNGTQVQGWAPCSWGTLLV